MSIDRVQLFNELQVKVTNDVRRSLRPKKFAEEVRDHWANKEAPSPWNPSPLTKTGPYATGDYAESIEIRQDRSRLGRFIAKYVVYTNHPNAHFIEYGTGPDAPDTHSPWGRFTPTPEFACAARTAAHFHGSAP